MPVIIEYFRYYSEVMDYLSRAKSVYNRHKQSFSEDIVLIGIEDDFIMYKVILIPYELERSKLK